MIFGDREPDAYARLMATLIFFNVNDESRVQSKSQKFISNHRSAHAGRKNVDAQKVRLLVKSFLQEVGAHILRALAEYEQGNYLSFKIKETLDHLESIWKPGEDLIDALARFSEDRAVRILTIHKSKGLEFDTVVLLGVENAPTRRRDEFFLFTVPTSAVVNRRRWPLAC